MGALRAGFHGTVGQPSAQIIDGSLKFAHTSSDFKYLKRTLTGGNRKTFTIAYWFKYDSNTSGRRYFSTGYNTGGGAYGFYIGDNPEITFNDTGTGSADYNVRPSARLRDSGWYHLVFILDTTRADANDRVRIYINGVQQTSFATNTRPSQFADGGMNTSGRVLTLGAWELNGNIADALKGGLAQFYYVDGQALEPENFGFTDPLTGTWRPKKYTGKFIAGRDFGIQASDIVSTTGFQGGEGADKVIDTGDFGANRAHTTAGNAGETLTVTFNPTVQVSKSLKVFAYLTVAGDNEERRIRVNGGSWFNPSSTADDLYDLNFTGTLSTIQIQYNGSVNSRSMTMRGILIDGEPVVVSGGETGENSFYLPFDGNSPIGQDKSEAGNDFTPINFGGSATLENPIVSGALPILNTSQGGTQAAPGYRTDANASSLILALPLVGNQYDVHHLIKGSGEGKSVTVSNVTWNKVSHFYNSSALFDSSSDYLRLASSPFDYGSGNFTMEFWCYLTGAYTTARHIISAWQDGGNQTFYVGTGGANGYWASFGVKIGGTQYEVNGNNNTGRIPQNNWAHIAAVRDGTNLKLFVNGSLVGTTACGSGSMISLPSYVYIGKHYSASGYEWAGNLSDLRIYKGVAKYTEDFVPASTNPDILPDSPSGVSGGSKLTNKLMTTDGGIYSGSTGYLTTTSSDYNPGTGDFAIEGYFRFPNNSGNRRAFINDTGGFGNNSLVIRQWNTGFEFYCGGTSFSDSGFDMSQWHHALVTRSGSTVRFFVDGQLRATRTTSQSISCEPTNQMTIGGVNSSNSGELMQGFASNLRLTVGSIPTGYQTSSTTAGEMIFTPSLVPLTSTSQGANSSHVKLLCCQSNTSLTAATVASGPITANGSAKATTFSPFNTIDTVRGLQTGYATFNPIDKNSTASLENGNLDWKTVNGNGCCRGTIAVSSGKWYFEFKYTEKPSGGGTGFGILSIDETKEFMGGSNAPDGYQYYSEGSSFTRKYNNGSNSVYGDSFEPGDLIGVALDMDGGTIEFYLNGASQGQAFSGISGTYAPAAASGTGSGTARCSANFGQKPFKFSPPDGFLPLNAANARPETVIARPDQHFGIILHTQNPGAVKRYQTSGGFAPDLVWAKERGGSSAHNLFDTIRGATKRLRTNVANGEDTQSNMVQSFHNDGFTYGVEYPNNSGQTGVYWCWKAGGNKNTFNVDDVGYASAAAAGLTGGNITPTGASVGTKQGFSIIKYDGSGTAGNTFPHGLLQTPEFVVVKDTEDGDNWQIYHAGAQTSGALLLKFTNDSATSNTGPWNNTAPTSSLITLGGGGTNDSGNSHICYAWHSVPGFSKFGSFTGNGSQNFVPLDFRPALVWVKRAVVNSSPDSDTSHSAWTIMDSKRLSYNGLTPNHLYINHDSGEGKRGDGSSTDSLADMTLEPMSNGFYLNGPGTEVNANTGTYVYCAWAETPTFNLYGGQSNAR